MASSITTTGTTSDPVSTTRQAGETTAQWIDRHGTSVMAATPGGNALITSWKSAAGDKSKRTDRNAGESDGDFKSRHITEYTAAMAANPPI